MIRWYRYARWSDVPKWEAEGWALWRPDLFIAQPKPIEKQEALGI